jgi:hypothetical protein
MKRRQVGAIAVLVVCALLFAVPTAGLGAAAPAQVNNTTDTPEGSFGQQVSSFMQASAVDANASVERGMWQASVNRTVEQRGDPSAKVTNRVARLERRLHHLRNRSERLTEGRDLDSVAYTAQASALRERIANLKVDIDAAGRIAVRAGLNTSRVDRLRSVAANATGPDVAAAARDITDVPRGPPATVPGRGQPADVGPGGTGPPEDAGSGDGGSSAAAEPEASGPPEDTGTENNRTEPPGGQAPTNEPTDDDAAPSGSGDESQDDDREADTRSREDGDDNRRASGGNDDTSEGDDRSEDADRGSGAPDRGR